jgi:uncharacterized membrane protein YedE/YeeE
MMLIDWHHFTPWSALIGGLLIGLAALLALLNNRVAGISGILGGLLRPARHDIAWRMAFVLGLMAAPWAYTLAAPWPASSVTTSLPLLIAGGLLVGLGTRYGSGCTSGHGVCGLARWSPRSLVATLCFMATGFITAGLARHLFH